MQGWIVLHRCLAEKAIWKNSTPEQKSILITLLMMANHKENEWEWNGNKFKALPGQFVTSLESIKILAGKGISTQNVRTALSKFKKYEFLTYEVTKTGRLITIINWGLYQEIGNDTNKVINKQLTKSQQRANKELTTNNNDNNDNNDKKEKEEKKPVTFSPDTQPLKLALHLRSLIQSNLPKQPLPPITDLSARKIQAWAKDIDLLHRKGAVGGDNGYSWAEIREVIDWCQDSEFWRGNILSPGKLREKIVTLTHQMSRKVVQKPAEQEYKMYGSEELERINL